MPHTISHKMKLPMLAGACALAIALAPASVLAAGGGGGHAGGMGGMSSMAARPMPSPGGAPARPIVAPPDHPTNPVNPTPPDRSSHAPFNKGSVSQPTPATTDVSSHAATGSPNPVAGTRLPPPTQPSAPRLDPPPHG